MRWLVDQIVEFWDAIPRLILDQDDPRVEFLRWWALFVVVMVIALIIGMIRRARRHDRNPRP